MQDQDEDIKKKNIPAPESKLNPEEEIEAFVRQSAVQGKRKKNRKVWFRRGLVLLIAPLFIWLIWFLFMPYKGSMMYGVCKVFLERVMTYPDTMQVTSVEEFSDSVRIWYMQTDSFGSRRMEPIQCYYTQHELYGAILAKVTMRRRDVDQKIVDDFNKTLPVVLAYPPDLTLPWPLPDTLKNLHYEVNRYMRPIL